MKCPVCGQWNRDSNPRCLKCGADLDPEDRFADEQPAWRSRIKDADHGTAYFRMDEQGQSDAEADVRDQLADEMADLKARKSDGSYRLRGMRTSSVYRDASEKGLDITGSAGADAYWQTKDDPAKPNIRFAKAEGPSSKESRTAVVGGERETADWGNSPRTDALWVELDQNAYSWKQRDLNRAEPPMLPRERFWRAFGKASVFAAVLLVLFIAIGSGLGLAGVLGDDGFLGIIHPLNRKDRNSGPSVIITASMMNDLAAHTIQIPGEDGQEIFIRELYSNYVVVDGYATIQVQDHVWYDSLESVTEPTMLITLTPYLKASNGQQTPMEPITYEIEIPLSPVTMVTPDSLRTTVASTMYTMEFVVRPGSVVKMNGKDISDTVNYETGVVSYNATVQPIGDNVFTLTCRSQYCRDNTLNIVLYREPQEIPLDLAADTYTSTTVKHLLISCTTLPGATVDVLSPFTDLDITNLATTGEFSFYATFDHYGDNVVTIQSSYPGKKTSTIQYTIYYVANVDDYTRSAWGLDAAGYSELAGNIAVRSARSQVYVVMGICHEIISDKPQIAVFYTSSDGKSQPVVVRNHTRTVWKQGSYYRIYADASGTYNSMPQLEARYCYDH